MGILSWIVFGLVAGIIAKMIMPGKDPGGIIITIVIGVVGAFIGGFMGTQIGLGGISGFNFGSLLTAVAGAIILLGLVRLLRSKG